MPEKTVIDEISLDSYEFGDFPDFGLPFELAFPNLGGERKIKSLADFEAYLIKRSPPEEAYGMFSADVTMCRFFETKNGENILADIEQKNAEQGMGNLQIPNTNIRLINYSVCP